MHSTTATATENLKEEHEVIERMLKILNVACERLERGEEVSPEIFKKAVDFIKTFSDRCHHCKEEDFLFPAVEARGIPRQGGPTGVMLIEHDQGRGFVRAFAEAVEKYGSGDKSAKQAIITNARSYVALLSQHIPKENDILYPLADRVLGPIQQKELLEKFEQLENERIGAGKHHEYLHLVIELEKELNIS